ncbi:FadR/GntR family transcriptional regulator [Paracoccus laeviglucosivorans]|uniref:Transcriptional regulator, GntR family n=1 Tax=Paracoccus laeviglucosivorans TaxID=1197861 RepID=A0A521E901_9RHOB|nr:FadR/GntR family transcriptional regulator [Paracoccus laeviglucosivorans]SMO80435.1 transcriptional regulator, GntR family [Paracoccus laeviglucosivorans]
MAEATGKLSRVTELVAALRGRIERGEYRPGDKLPTEPLLSAEFGVSRTVIREAVAALRADGLLLSRQGSGVFVLEPPQPAYPMLREVDQTRLSSVLSLLELRIAIEAEAAALAAQRCTPEQEEHILTALAHLRAEVAAGRIAAEADYALHLAIAAASGNPRFVEILTMLGPGVIPRAGVGRQPTADPGYLAALDGEHMAVIGAIQDRDAEAARRLMREHLGQSQRRYRAMQMSG